MFEWLTEIDHFLLFLIQEYIRAPWLTPAVKFITSLGNAGWFWILLSLIFLCFKKTRKAGLAGLLALLLCFVVTNIGLKNIVARMRPYNRFDDIFPLIAHPKDFSFPSGHSASSFAAASAYLRFLPNPARIIFIVLAVLIALSRLYLGVHYPTDVISGIIIGLLSGWAISLLMKKSGRSES